MDLLDSYRDAVQRNVERVAATAEDQLSQPTPCPDWTVATLIDHLTGGYQMFAASLGHDLPANAGTLSDAHQAASNAAVAAFGSVGAMEQKVHLPIGDMNGQQALGAALTETVVHGWDLAKATGQDTSIDDHLASALLGQLEATIGPEVRPGGAMHVFGEPVIIDSGSPAGDRLVAFLGRQP